MTVGSTGTMDLFGSLLLMFRRTGMPRFATSIAQNQRFILDLLAMRCAVEMDKGTSEEMNDEEVFYDRYHPARRSGDTPDA